MDNSFTKVPFIIFLLLLIIAFSCREDDVSGVSKCIQEEVVDFQKEFICDDASVTSYLFQREVVYTYCYGDCIIDGGCRVLNADCESLGFLGGIGGVTQINGEEFSNAILIEIVWENQ